MAASRLNLFGGFRLEPGEAMAVAPKKVKALLAYLALNAGIVHSRDRLGALLWEASGETQARQSLRQALADLRKALPAANEVLCCAHDTVTLVAGGLAVDVLEFERLSAQATTEALEQAAALYRGELLEGLNARAPAFDDWLAWRACRTREQAIAAMTRLLDRCVETGATEPGVQLALRLLALDPLREPAHRALMQLYAKQGRVGAALRQYQSCRRVLACELGVAPEPATIALHERMLRDRRQGPATVAIPHAAGRIGPGCLPGTPAGTVRPHVELVAATVLSARIADFASATARLDPEALRERLDRFYATVDSQVRHFGGVVAKQANELAVAVFGLPGSRGSDTEHAVRAAAAIHGAMDTPLRTQIGIAGGKVLADEVGSTHHREVSLIGSCVALSAELARKAPVGATLIAEQAYRCIAARFDALRVPDGAASDAIEARAWQLGAERCRGRPPLVGRQPELRAFSSALQTCRSMACGQSYLIRAEAGMGKTRLIEEFEALARAQGFATHKALVLDFGVEAGQDAVRTLVRSLLGIDWAGDAGQLQRAADAALADRSLETCQKVFVADLLGLPLAAEHEAAWEAMEAGVREEGRRAALACLIARHAARQPLVLSVEDIHWADAATLAQLTGIGQAIAGCAALFVMSARSEAEPLDPAWRGAMHGAALTTLDLAPLRDAEAVDLGRNLSDQDDQVVRHCVERAGGNPFFLEQLLCAARDTPGCVPHSVHSLVQVRLSRLDTRHRRAARAAAVLGQRFSLPALRCLLGEPDYVCDALLEHRFVRPWGEQYLFTHALVAESVYDGQVASERRRLHRAAADYFAGHDAALVAEHLDRAGEPTAARAYLDAAWVRLAGGRDDDALRLARRGAALDPDPGTWHELACLEAELLQERGELDASIEAYERVVHRASASRERCRGWIGMAAALRVQDRYGQALDCLQHAEQAASRPDELAQIQVHRGNLMLPLGRADECLAAHERALRLAREAASPVLEARALGGLGDACYLKGRMRTAQEHFGHCIELSRAHGFRRIEVAHLAMRGVTSFYALKVRAAIEDASAAAEQALQVANRRAEAIARNVCAYLLYYAAQHESALHQAEQALALAHSLGSKRFEIKSLLNIGLALEGLGQHDRAQQRLSEAYSIGLRSGIELWAPWVLGALALCADPATQACALEQGERLLAGGGCGHNALHFHQLAMEVALAAGHAGQVRHHAARLQAATSGEPLPWSEFYIARAHALAQHMEGRSRREVDAQLNRLESQALTAGLMQAVPALQAALSAESRFASAG